VSPPGAKGTTMRSGRDGKSCAQAVRRGPGRGHPGCGSGCEVAQQATPAACRAQAPMSKRRPVASSSSPRARMPKRSSTVRPTCGGVVHVVEVVAVALDHDQQVALLVADVAEGAHHRLRARR
jgi:hypothetical protein